MNQFDVILTHEYTDFDALASLLGASLLYPDALPILPSRLNRNVRTFLDAYGSRYPFLERKDVPRGHVQRAILVDTRGVNQVKGMDEETDYFVIDHHRHEEPMPAGWTLVSEAVGANTTLLIEMLMARGVSIKPDDATLLALGIHEDTGSLTYAATTHRDVYCLAWLMEPQRGADIQLIGRCVHHPLSESQRLLLQQLKEQTEFLRIHDYNIAVAQKQVTNFEDEFSALAARLRDDLDVDAMFLIIEQEESVQMIARSTVDDIDVAAIARRLSGGGHARAAAAVIQQRTGLAVRDRIVELATNMIEANHRARFTVRQIMSAGRPRTLAPTMSIEDALTLMRRYGHEGFPVVTTENGRDVLLGMFTRREADRAQDHGLGAEPVSRFMRTGQFTVTVDASIAALREVMHSSGWGQVPVTDEGGRIVGIVTRTDLVRLDIDGRRAARHSPAAIAQRLRHTLTPEQHGLLRILGQIADELNSTLYVVGGFVRDLLLERGRNVATFDLDIVVEGEAIAFAQQIQSQLGGRVVTHKRFGTAKWILNDPDEPLKLDQLAIDLGDLTAEPLVRDRLPSHLDFVTARTEFYTAPTVLPTVESSGIRFDLYRRDFTINTLAVCLSPQRWGTLLDFFGGDADLERGIVRVLHSLSFVDDPTRMLRAARYEQRFGFRIEPRTIELLRDALPLLEQVTAARVRHELDRCLQEQLPEKTLWRLDELGILARLHSLLSMSDETAARFVRLRAALGERGSEEVEEQKSRGEEEGASVRAILMAEPVERLYWVILVYPLSSEVDSVLATRLGLRQETQRLVADVRILQQHLPRLRTLALRPSEAATILARVAPVALALLQVICKDEALTSLLQQYLIKWQHVQPVLNGHDLRELGILPGPQYRAILSILRAARLDGEISTRDEEVALALEMAQKDRVSLSG